jgi:hypothetical protein
MMKDGSREVPPKQPRFRLEYPREVMYNRGLDDLSDSVNAENADDLNTTA